mmetsp:Transcript_9300/g.26739  ORF Transcript_9300/g.26739 Transcript_9300/m.26739 type:complete len:476 (-) Transcript_9300:462-1889(-)
MQKRTNATTNLHNMRGNNAKFAGELTTPESPKSWATCSRRGRSTSGRAPLYMGRWRLPAKAVEAARTSTNRDMGRDAHAAGCALACRSKAARSGRRGGARPLWQFGSDRLRSVESLRVQRGRLRGASSSSALTKTSMSVMSSQALVSVRLAMADPCADDLDHCAARDGTRAAREHPEGVGCEIVVPRHEAVDVLRRHSVIEALTPEGKEDGEPCHHPDAQSREVHPSHAASEPAGESDHVRLVRIQGEAIPHPPRDHVAEADEDEKDSHKAVFVHQVLVIFPPKQWHDLVVEGVKVGRQRTLHHKVADNVHAHEGEQRGQPSPPLQDRLVDCRGSIGGCLAVFALLSWAQDGSHFANSRNDPLCEDKGADGHARYDVPEQRFDRDTERQQQKAEHIDNEEGGGEAHNCPTLGQWAQWGDHVQERALEDAERQADQAKRDEYPSQPLAAQREDEQRWNDSTQADSYHCDVHAGKWG